MKKMMFAAVAALLMGMSLTSCSKSPEEKALSSMRKIVELTEKVKSNPLKALDLADDIDELRKELDDLKIEELNFTPEQKAEFEELSEKAGSTVGSIFGF